MSNTARHLAIYFFIVCMNEAVKYPVWDGIRIIGRTSCEGRVDIKINGTWGSICNKGWGIQDTAVACRQLGFSGYVGTLQRSQYESGSGPIYLSSVRCSGREQSLDNCHAIRDPALIQCHHRLDVGIKCLEPKPIRGTATCGDRQFLCKADNMCIPKSWQCDFHEDCRDGSDEELCIPPINIPIGHNYLRLVNNMNDKTNEGRLEIKYVGYWGTICDDRFDINAANVACRQLGFPGAVGLKYFGGGSGQIWLDELSCTGSESSLMECRRNNFGAHDCTHNEDVGIICKEKKECGTQAFPVGNSRIVGGEPASKGSWPWMASIQFTIPTGELIHFCGGTLVDESWVMTAAHCFDKSTDTRRFLVRLGRSNIKKSETMDQSFNISRIYIHPQYRQPYHNNDIALVRLDRPANLSSDFVNTACLPSPDGGPFSEKDFCYAIGWGATHGSGNSHILRQVKLPVLPQSVCQGLYAEVTSEMMCAGYMYGGRDACQGDSGGPLICRRNRRWTVGGIISWGQGCAQALHPGVYVRVSSHVSWIEGIITNNKMTVSQSIPVRNTTAKPNNDIIYNAFG